ncbi:peptide/nickel transport system substrate-binding protein [Anoxybacillus vitaminiphilus]|uniref:Peptide/nickel transport system substrate-binding protein n=1 Tax=Paranoxybacillus vitaminiphilus TaxID=581036 RepID=A0A327YM29_9BACL|nr:nickel ABC transporter substrate-binding protein [Anoxybacillus vitaminiphilus]RAK22043.1 peptide/nickel transport system substrate-binding protein [Anoxybacillus vitaminiphilus]
MFQHLKRLFILLFIVMLAGCSLSSSGEEKKGGKELTLLFNFPTDTLDPHLDSNYTAVRAGVGETLVKINEKLELQPWLAEEWESKDGQHWTIKIREGVTFHNGKKVDAQAVKDSLERAIKDSQAVKAALKIRKIEANGQLLIIETEEVFPQFPSELVHPNTAIIDVSEQNFDKKPIGTGPFKVSSFEPGVALKVERFEKYWDGKAKLEKATFAFNEDANARLMALQSGDADIIFRPPVESLEQLEKEGNVKVQSVPSLRTHQLTFNMDSPYMKDENVRKAIDAFVDRKEIAEQILSGHAVEAKGPFLTDFPFTPSYEEKKHGIEVAKQYFIQAGFKVENGKLTKDGKNVQLKALTYSARPELPLIAQLLQSKAKELGIEIKIQQVENIDEYLANNDDWDLVTYSNLTAPRGDAAYYLNATYGPNGALNYAHIDHPQLTKIINKLNQTVEVNERNELAKQALVIIDQEALHSFIVHPNIIVAYRDNVKNWVTSRSEYYMLTKDLDVDK